MAIFDIFDSTILINFLLITQERGWGIKKNTKNFKKIIQRRYGNGKKDVLDFTGNVNWD
ncbi:MAG: hypothetical protein ACXVCD_18330 [Pseudobdellovibrionaceae bacterium]